MPTQPTPTQNRLAYLALKVKETKAAYALNQSEANLQAYTQAVLAYNSAARENAGG